MKLENTNRNRDSLRISLLRFARLQLEEMNHCSYEPMQVFFLIHQFEMLKSKWMTQSCLDSIDFFFTKQVICFTLNHFKLPVSEKVLTRKVRSIFLQFRNKCLPFIPSKVLWWICTWNYSKVNGVNYLFHLAWK